MPDQMRGRDDPTMRRLQRAFADEEPTTELADVFRRAVSYRAADLQDADDQLNRDPASASEGPSGHAMPGRPMSAPDVSPPAAIAVPAALANPLRSLQPPGQSLTEADLGAARRRDPAAVTRIYRAYAPALYRFFAAALGDRHAAEDLTGTVFAAAIEALPGFRGPVEALGGWLFRIARHDLYDHRRRQARALADRLDDILDEAAIAVGAPDPQEIVVERLEGSRLMAALDELSVDQREVLLLRIAAGLTAAEVAATLGKTTAAVKALQHRGLARLFGLRDQTEAAQRPHPSHDPQRATNQQHPEEQMPS